MLNFSLFWLLAMVVLTVLAVLAWWQRAAIVAYFDSRTSANPFRMVICGVAAACCLFLVDAISPVQLPVTVYKLALVLLAGYLGYWMDVWLFPYSRPDGYLRRNWQEQQGFKPDAPDHEIVLGYETIFAAALIRRSIIVGLCMLAVGQAL